VGYEREGEKSEWYTGGVPGDKRRAKPVEKREGKSKVEGNREDRMSKFGEEASRRQGEIVISGTG